MPPLKLGLPLPPVIRLGRFPAARENVFTFCVETPGVCRIACAGSGITLVPESLQSGENQVTLTLAPLREDVQIYTRLCFSGGETLWMEGTACEGGEVAPFVPDFSHGDVRDAPRELLPPDEEGTFAPLPKGARAVLSQGAAVQVQLSYHAPEGMPEIDGYAFLLQADGKTAKDEDMVFWGNAASETRAVCQCGEEQPFFLIQPQALPERVCRIALCYSIYGDDPAWHFRDVESPYVRVIVDGVERYRFYLEGLEKEKTVVALEFYRYQGAWRMKCVGAGYYQGLRHLCEAYGVEVAE